MRAICIAVWTSAVLLAATAAPSWAAEPTVEGCGIAGDGIRPPTVVLTCADGGLVAHDLRWTDWGAPRTDATGILTAKTCDPSCAAGGTEDYPVQLTADRLRTCRDGRQRYTRITYAFPQTSPFEPDAPGAVDPTLDYPCPLPEPKLLSLSMRLRGVNPGVNYYVRVTVRVRYCAPAQRSVRIVVHERILRGDAFRFIEYPRSHVAGGCVTRTVKFKLADQFFGIGTYRVSVSIQDTQGQSSRQLYRQVVTSD